MFNKALSRSSLAFGWLLFSALGAAAQIPNPFDVDGRHFTDLTCSAGEGLKGVVVSHMSSDMQLDGVAYGAGISTFLYGLGGYEAVKCLTTTNVLSAVALPLGAGGGLDAVLGTTSSGLGLLKRTPSGYTTNLLAGGSWAGATRVQVGDWNNDTYPDAVGLPAAQGNDLVFISNVLGGSPTSSTISLPEGEDIHDFVLMDWENDGDSEIVAWASLGSDSRIILWDYENNPQGQATLIYDRAFIPNNVLLVPLEYPDGENNRIAMLIETPTHIWMVATASQEGSDHRSLLGNLGLVGAAAGCLNDDVGTDEYPDLVVSTVDGTLLVLINQLPISQSTYPTEADFTLEPDSSAPPDQVGTPTLADLDNDGDVDLAYPMLRAGPQPTIAVYPGSLVDRDESAPWINELYSTYLEDDSGVPDELELTLQIDRQDTPPELEPVVDGIEVVVWRITTGIEGANLATAVQAGIVDVGPGAWTTKEVDVTLEYEDWSDVLHTLEIREVQRVSGVVVAAGPTLGWIVHEEGVAELVKQEFVEVLPEGSLPLIGLQSGGNVIINVFPTPWIPHFDNDEYVLPKGEGTGPLN
jgi:hypothetical protein